MTADQIVLALDGMRYTARLDALGPDTASLQEKREALARYQEFEATIDPNQAFEGQRQVMNYVLSSGKRCLKRLLPLFETPMPEVRAYLIDATTLLQEPEIAAAVRERLAKDASPLVRARAAAALGCHGDDRDTGLLLELLGTTYRPEPVVPGYDVEARWQRAYRNVIVGPPTDIRIGAAHALGLLRNLATQNALILLLDDPSYDCRAAALEGLLSFGDPEVVPILEQTLYALPAATPENRLWREMLANSLETLRAATRGVRR